MLCCVAHTDCEQDELHNEHAVEGKQNMTSVGRFGPQVVVIVTHIQVLSLNGMPPGTKAYATVNTWKKVSRSATNQLHIITLRG